MGNGGSTSAPPPPTSNNGTVSISNLTPGGMNVVTSASSNGTLTSAWSWTFWIVVSRSGSAQWTYNANSTGNNILSSYYAYFNNYTYNGQLLSNYLVPGDTIWFYATAVNSNKDAWYYNSPNGVSVPFSISWNTSTPYTGGAITPTYASVSPSLSYSISWTYRNSAGTTVGSIVNAGAYSCYYTMSYNNYAFTSGAISFTISKVATTITLTGTSQTTNGNPLVVGPTTYGSDTITYTYYSASNPSYNSTGGPSAAGTYTITATSTNYSYTISGTNALTVSNAGVSVSANNTTQVYTGSAYSPSYGNNGTAFGYTTSVGNISVSIAYYSDAGGTVSATMTNAGNYWFIITITQAGYSGNSGLVPFVVSRAPATITLGGTTQTQGSASAGNITATYSPPGASSGASISYLYNGSTTFPTEVGSYNITISVSGNTNYNYSLNVPTTLIIQSLPVLDITVTSVTNSGVSVSLNGVSGFQDASSYYYNINLEDPTNDTVYVYNKYTPFTTTTINFADCIGGPFPPGGFTFAPTPGVTYKFLVRVIRFRPGIDQNAVGIISNVVNFSLPATYSITSITNITSVSFTLNVTNSAGTWPQWAYLGFKLFGTDSFISYTILGNFVQLTGPSRTFTFYNPSEFNGYNPGPGDTVHFAIGWSPDGTKYPDDISLATTTFTIAPYYNEILPSPQYYGSPQLPPATDATTSETLTYTYTGTSGKSYGPSTSFPTSAGVGYYSVSAVGASGQFFYTVNGSNSATIRIDQPTANITVLTPQNYGSVSVQPTYSDDTIIYTFTGTNGTSYPQSTTIPTNLGSYTLTLSSTSGNYIYTANSQASITFVIQQAPVTITLSGTTQTYSATTLSVGPTSYNSDTISYSYSASPVNVGTYTVTASSTNYTYTISGTNTFTIVPAVIDIAVTTTQAFGALAQPTMSYNGDTLIYRYTGTNGTTYPQSTSFPTSAGSYTVVISSTTGNYTYTMNGGNSSVTLALNQGTFDIYFPSSQTYAQTTPPLTDISGTGDMIVYSFTGTLGTGEAYGGSQFPENVGSYSIVSATGSSGQYTYTFGGVALPVPFSITRASYRLTLTNTSQNYTGQSLRVGPNTIPDLSGVEPVVYTYYSASNPAYNSTTPPSAVGVYTVTATAQNFTITIDTSQGNVNTLTISQSSSNIILSTPQTYGSTTPPPTTSSFTQEALTYTYVGTTNAGAQYNSTTFPPNTGTYTVTVAGPQGTPYIYTINGGASASLTINPQAATITVGNLSQTVGSVTALTQTFSPAGASADVTLVYYYNGSPTLPTNAGGYPITLSSATGNNNYTYSLVGSPTLIIGAQSVTVTLTNLTQTWPASAPTLTFSVPAASTGFVPSYTYRYGLTLISTTNPPSVPGNYTITATISSFSENYIYTYTNASASFVINPAGPVNLTTTNYTFSGESVILQPTTFEGDTLTYLVGGNSVPSAVGTGYTVSGITGQYGAVYTVGATKTFAIVSGSSIVLPTTASVTYDGNQHSAAQQSSEGSDTLTFYYNGSATLPINAGTYTVTIIGSSGNYTYTPSSSTFTIIPASVTFSLNNTSQTYGSVSLIPSLSPVISSVIYSYNGISGTIYSPNTAPPTSTGSYQVSVYESTGNYTVTPGVIAFTINKATTTITATGLTASYTGAPVSISPTSVTNADNSTDTITYNYQSSSPAYNSRTPPTAIGTYTVTAPQGSSTNYNYTMLPSVFTISANAATLLLNSSQSSQTFTYGSVFSLTPSVSGYTVPSQNVQYTYTGTGSTTYSSQTAPVNAGTYSLSVSDPLSSGLYVFSNTPIAFTINPQTITFSFNGSSSSSQTFTYGSASLANAAPSVVPSISLTYAYVGAQGTTYPSSASKPTGFGTYTVAPIVQSPLVSGNYTFSPALITIGIGTSPAIVTLTNLTQSYGSVVPLTYTVDISGANGPITFLYNGSSSLPTASGTYTVTLNTTPSTNYSYTIVGNNSFVIGKVTTTWQLVNPKNAYTGSPVVARVTFSVPAAAATVTYKSTSGGLTVTSPPSSVDTYYISLTNRNPNYNYDPASDDSYIMTIEQVEVSISINKNTLAQLYTGSGIAISATTTIPVSSIKYTYTNNATGLEVKPLPIELGSYNVTATIEDPNYDGSESGTLTISPVIVSIFFSNLTNLYSGSSISALATTNPAGHIVNLTYNGSGIAPSNVGSYRVVGIVDTTRSSNFIGSNSATLTIAQSQASISLLNMTQTYTGRPIVPTVLTIPTGANADITYNGLPNAVSSVGSYSVVATINDNNLFGSASGTLQVNQASGVIQIDSNTLIQPYTGSPIYLSTITFPVQGVNTTVKYNNSLIGPTVPGTYGVTAVMNDPNFAGSNFYTLVVTKGPGLITLGNLSQSYTGLPLNPTVSTAPPGLATSFNYIGYGSNVSSVNSYVVTTTLNDTLYQGTTSNIFTITKGIAQIGYSNLLLPYTGSSVSVSTFTTPSNLNTTTIYSTLNYTSNVAPSNVGSYTISTRILDSQYQGSNVSTFTIGRASTIFTWYSTTQVYAGGSNLAPSYTTYPSYLSTARNRITFDYYDAQWNSNVGTCNVGTYYVVPDVNDKNYGSGNVSTLFTITKAPIDILFSTNSFLTVSNVSFPIMTFPYTGSNVNAVANTELNYVRVSSFEYISPTYRSIYGPSTVGTYTVIATVNTSNYFNIASSILVVSYATGRIITTNSIVQYSSLNASTGIIATSIPPASTFTYYYSSSTYASSNPPTSLGTYIAYITILDNNVGGVASTPYSVVTASSIVYVSAMTVNYTSSYITNATTVPPGLAISSYTYTNKSTLRVYNSAPSNAGNYTIRAFVNNAYYFGSSISTLVINPIQGEIALTALIQPYTGGPLAPTGITKPFGLVTATTNADINGSNITRGISSIGQYNVISRIDENNYYGTTDTATLFSIVLGSPRNLKAYPTNSGAILTWNPPLHVDAPPIMNYRIITIPSNDIIYTSSTYVKVPDLTNGSNYNFTVAAQNANGVWGIPNQAFVTLYSGSGTPGCYEGSALLAQYSAPTGVAVDRFENIYVADTNNNSVRVIYPNESAGTCTFITGLSTPQGLTIGPNDNIYVADTGNHAIKVFSTNGHLLTTYGTPTVQGNTNTGNINLENPTVTFNKPTGLAVDLSGNIFVADYGNNLIRKINTLGIVTTYAASGAPYFSDAQGTSANLKGPYDVALDTYGNLYVADRGNYAIRKVDKAQNVTTVAGQVGVSGLLDGTVGMFGDPSKLVIDGANNIYVADTANNEIRMLVPILGLPTYTTTTIAGYGIAGGTDGYGNVASFNKPYGLAMNKYMNLFVADSGNNKIRQITFNPIANTTPSPTTSNIPLPPMYTIRSPSITSVTLGWRQNTYNNIVPIEGYIVTYGSPTTSAITFITQSTGTVISGLLADTTYTFGIQTSNVFGASLTATSTILKTSVTNVIFTFSNITQYATGATLKPSITITDVTNTIITASYTLIFTDLSGSPATPINPGIYIAKAAINRTSDNSQYSGSSQTTFTILSQYPTKPLNVSVSLVGNTLVSLGWSQPENLGNAPNVNYVISATTTPNTPFTPVTISDTTTTIRGLTNGVRYIFSIVAQNTFGASPASAFPPLTPTGPPLAPMDVTAFTTNAGTVYLSWIDSPNTNGYPITSYVIKPIPQNGGSTTILPLSWPYSPSTIGSTIVNGILGGYTYKFAVAAVSGGGQSPYSVNSGNAYPLTAPDRPVLSVYVGNQKANISWGLPHSGGVPIQYYVINTMPDTGTYSTINGSVSSIELMGLTNGVSYSFSVYGVNTLGRGLTGTSPFTAMPLGAGGIGDPYITTIRGVHYKLPTMNAPIRFYQGMVDGELLTVNATLRTTTNDALLQENIESFIHLKDSIPTDRWGPILASLFGEDNMAFFETVYVEWGSQQLSLNIWEDLVIENRSSEINYNSCDGAVLQAHYSKVYKDYPSKSLEFHVGSAKIYVSMYNSAIVRNGLFVLAPNMADGNGVIVNTLSKEHMILQTLTSTNPVPQTDSPLLTTTELFIDHSGFRSSLIHVPS